MEEEGGMARPLLLLVVAGGEAPGGEAAAHTAGHPGSGAGQHAGDWDEAAGDDVKGCFCKMEALNALLVF